MNTLELYANTNICKKHSGTVQAGGLSGRATVNLCYSELTNKYYWDMCGYNNHFGTPELAIKAIKQDIKDFKEDIYE
tara:strand:- start:6517 stop:6747 length:231 start_codon:yes stop_codon:yes gene_type:complete